MTHPSGRALLAIIRGGIGQDDFDGPWREIAPTIQFLPAADVASLEDVGTAEASRLRRAGYEKLLADRDLAWWLWTSHDAYVGWSSIDFPGRGGALAGKKQAHIRLSIGERVSHVTHDFSYDDESPQYTSTVAREQADPDTRVKTVQKTTLAAGKLSMSFQSGDRDEVQLWNAESAPPQFVPGALLPLVLGQLSRDPMLLVTDSFPGREGIGPPRPLTLIIRPGDDATATTAMTATTATTRAAAAGESTPMRSVTVQVNGTGSISRWYFRNTGELERVDWSGGVQQLASDENAVKHNFPKGDPLAP
jgi:hypothetical protein